MVRSIRLLFFFCLEKIESYITVEEGKRVLKTTKGRAKGLGIWGYGIIIGKSLGYERWG